MRKFISFVLAVFMIIFTAALIQSCSDNNNSKNNLKELDFENINIGRVIEGCDTTKDCTSINFYYPRFMNESKNSTIDSINNFIMDKLLFEETEFDSTATLEKIVNEFIEDYKIQVKDFPEYDFPWYSNTKVSVEYQNDKYLTIKIINENYTGGAHPNSFTNYFVINKNNAKQVSIEDIFKSGFEKQLNNEVSFEFRKVRNINTNKSLSDEGFWFEDAQKIYNENFGLSENGITFYYNPYDVAPYSMGPTMVEVPYSKINEILNL